MQVIHTSEAPEAIGTYSQAIRCGNTVYISGQIPLDPLTMQLCSEEITLQINQVMENLSAVCKAAGGTLAHLVKLSVYLTNLDYFPLINEAMAVYFSPPYPARAAIEVSALPRKAQVEIEGIMILSDSTSTP